MSQANKDLGQRWFEEVWNKGNVQGIDEMLADDAVIHGLLDLSGNPISDRNGFRQYHAQFRGAFPDLAVTLHDIVGEGDIVALRCSVKAKHSGPNLGIAATNRDVAITGMAFIRVADGRIAEAWNNFDFQTMRQQLGFA